MTIRVARGVLSRIRSHRDNIVIQVRDASDPEAAAVALERAATEIGRMDAGWDPNSGMNPEDPNTPKYVSPVSPTANGPFISIDAGEMPYRVLRTIPDIVARHLEEAGVTEATIASPKEGGPLTEALGGMRLPRAVVLRLLPPPPQRWREFARIPDAWLDEAAAWVQADLGDDEQLSAAVIAIEFIVAAKDARAFLEQTRQAHAGSCMLVAGEPLSTIRGVAGYFFGFEPNLALAGGGPKASDEELLDTMAQLKDVARRLAPEVGYAFVSIEDSFNTFQMMNHGNDWSWVAGGEPPGRIAELCDEFVFEAFPWQVLGPGHLKRVGGMPPGARALGGGRVEVALGEPSAWLLDRREEGWTPYHGLAARRRDKGVQEAARAVLRPCLLRRGEAHTEKQARRADNQQSAVSGDGR